MNAEVVVDDALLAQVMAEGEFPSATAAVEEALRLLIADYKGRQAIEALAGIGWEGDLDAMREGRPDHKTG